MQPTWVPCSRTEPPAEPFTSTDSFDFYIDGCRHLPDVVTISRVLLHADINNNDTTVTDCKNTVGPSFLFKKLISKHVHHYFKLYTNFLTSE